MDFGETEDVPEGAWAMLEEVEYALAEGDYERVAKWSALTSPELREAVTAYHAQLRADPASLRSRAIVFHPRTGLFRIDLPLVTKEEGRSQLYLFVDVLETEGRASIMVDGIGVP